MIKKKLQARIPAISHHRQSRVHVQNQTPRAGGPKPMPQIVLCDTVEYHQLSRWMKSKSECAFLVAMTSGKRRSRSGSDLREAVAEFSAFKFASRVGWATRQLRRYWLVCIVWEYQHDGEFYSGMIRATWFLVFRSLGMTRLRRGRIACQ